MKTTLRKILEEIPTEELKNALALTDRLLIIIEEGCEETQQRKFGCDTYVELLLLKSSINRELTQRNYRF